MIPFEEALNIVLNNAIPFGEEVVGMESAAGRILSRDVFSDIDMPPFDKSAVDGFACRMRDAGYGMELRVIETIAAGSVPSMAIQEGECSRIMTGGMLPVGADAVIMVEDTEISSAGTIKFIKEKTAINICYRAEDIRNGQKVLEKGTRIEPAHFAVLASVGNTGIHVARQPHIGIISTGNELVEPGQKPEGARIRNSNAWQLLAQARQIPALCSYYGIADDSLEELKDKISMGLFEADIVILTGGVSMGDFDYVPEAMESLGAKILFKSVAIQPGRPTVFARYNEQFIFGLPGNPVSSFVLFELMVKPFVLKMMGCNEIPRVHAMPMGVDFSRKKSSRKSVIPVTVDGGAVYPIEYHGSAHINAYTRAGGMMIMDIGQTEIRKGEPVNVRLL
ncbi:MAG: molybdopterin molybdotransferase MoeA [Bacteroidetes bacterium]|nr:molybdopterin molybdotransferase MoeA [Bacteroidota bacterium]